MNVLERDQSPASKILDMSKDPWAAVDEPTDLTNPALASRIPAEVMVPFSHPANVCVVTGLCCLLVLVLKNWYYRKKGRHKKHLFHPSEVGGQVEH